MGIRGLYKAIKQFAPKAVKEKILENYRGSLIAIDSEILLYQFRARAIKQSEFHPDNFHLYAFTKNAINFLQNGILPIYIFDGRPPQEKNEVLNKRHLDRVQNEQEVSKLEKEFLEKLNERNKSIENPKIYEEHLTDEETLVLLDTLMKAQSKCTSVSRTHRQECKYLLKLLGLPVINAEGEAEALCVRLAKNHFVDYIFTEDSDAITYAISMEGPNDEIKVIRKGSEFNTFQEFCTKTLLQDLKFTNSMFLDFCIMSGCDYCPTIPRIASITSYKLIKEHKNIEKCIQQIKNKYKIPDNFDYERAREIFKVPSIVHTEISRENLILKQIDKEKIQEFLKEKSIESSFFIDNFVIAYNNYTNIRFKESLQKLNSTQHINQNLIQNNTSKKIKTKNKNKKIKTNKTITFNDFEDSDSE